MPAVSQREWLRRSRGADTADEHDEQLQQHGQEDVPPPPPPAAPVARPFAARRYGTSVHTAGAAARSPGRFARSEEGHQARHPEPGHAQGVPPPKALLPGTHHYLDKEVTEGHAPLDVGPAKPYYSGGMAHGVPAPPVHGGRPAPPEPQQLVAQLRAQTAEQTGRAPDPVPVYIVPRGAGARPLQRAALRSVTIPAAGADPQVLVPRNSRRTSVRVLNESNVAVRIAFDLTLSGGALLPASMTSYLEIDSQDEICAYCPTGGPALISVIDQYSVPNMG